MPTVRPALFSLRHGAENNPATPLPPIYRYLSMYYSYLIDKFPVFSCIYNRNKYFYCLLFTVCSFTPYALFVFLSFRLFSSLFLFSSFRPFCLFLSFCLFIFFSIQLCVFSYMFYPLYLLLKFLSPYFFGFYHVFFMIFDFSLCHLFYCVYAFKKNCAI